MAWAHGHLSVVEVLENGMQRNLWSVDRANALVRTCHYSYLGDVRLILEDLNAAANMKRLGQPTYPTLEARGKDHLEVVLLLLGHGADPCGCRMEDGKNELHLVRPGEYDSICSPLKD